ncbi:MAG TPA: methyltransferase domain-containing protein [Mycobacteriales bacterium]|nr:methyltransferase domain-containing protein [Mycobacteriales bacterium]
MVTTDRTVLRTEQYADSRNLMARVSLHARFGVGPMPWFDWVFDRLPRVEAARVLEVGCGGGLLWQHTADRIPPAWDLLFSDLSDGMVAEATAAVPRARGIVADVASLPLRDAAVDVAVANHMLYHVPDVPRAVHELRRVLRATGTLVAATNGRQHMAEVFEIEHDALPDLYPRSRRTRLGFAVENGEELLRRSFGDVVRHDFQDGLRVDEVEPLVDYIGSMSPRRLTDDELERIAAVVRRRLAGGPIRITKQTSLFVARRHH